MERRYYRPTGVTVIAILCFLVGASSLLSAFRVLSIDIPAELEPLSGWILGVGLFALVFAALYIAIGWGLWELRDWARMAAITLSVLGLIFCLMGGIYLIGGIEIPYLGPIRLLGPGLALIVLAVIYGLVIWYLFQPDVESAFVEGKERIWEVPRYGVPTPGPTERAAPPPMPRARPLEPTRRLVEERPAMAWMVVRSGARAGKQFGLGTGRNTIGRDGTVCDIILDDEAVSAQHAQVNFENGQFVIYDLASTNGTFVNKRRVQRTLLMDGDLIQVGNTILVFKKV